MQPSQEYLGVQSAKAETQLIAGEVVEDGMIALSMFFTLPRLKKAQSKKEGFTYSGAIPFHPPKVGTNYSSSEYDC